MDSPVRDAWLRHDLALRNGAVQGNHAAHADDHLISGLYLVERDQFLSAFGFHPDPVDIQGHAPGQVFHGLFVGPLLQKLAQPQQEHHGTGRVEVPPYHGQADGDPSNNSTWSCLRSRHRSARNR